MIVVAVTYPRRLNRAGGWENIRTLLHDDHADHDPDHDDVDDGDDTMRRISSFLFNISVLFI